MAKTNTGNTAEEALVTAGESVADASKAVVAEASGKFDKAVEDAKAGIVSLKEEAKVRAGAYQEEAKVYLDQAREKGVELAIEGKAKASGALSVLSKTISDNAALIDEKLGVQYGEYARSAAKAIEGTAASLDSKDLAELGEEAREFVRKSPGLAIGIAAVVGFALSRMLRGSKD